MKALTFQQKHSVSCESVPDPKVENPQDAILRVRLAGLCGSDLHVYHGRETGLDSGTILGHELVGEVVEAGSEVNRFAKGDLVASAFSTSCGDCFFCRTGLTSRCQRGELLGWVEQGRGLHGAQAEYVRIPLADSTLVKVPEGVHPEEALFAGDILATGFFCADRGGVGPESVAVVVGCGPVGLMAILGARERDAQRIFAVDSIPERLQLAERFGAVPLNHLQEDPVEAVRAATGGRGADVVLEAVGSPAAVRLALDLLRPGGTLSSAGVHTERSFAFSPVEAYDKNLTFRAGRCPARHYMGRLLPLIGARRYDLRSVISHRLPLEEGERAYAIFSQKLDRCTKVVFLPWGEGA